MLFNISTSVYYYQAKRSDDSEVIEQLSILADLHRTWGFWMMYHRLRKLQFMWNHKRVYRNLHLDAAESTQQAQETFAGTSKSSVIVSHWTKYYMES